MSLNANRAMSSSFADQLDDLVDVIESDPQTFQDVESSLCLRKFVAGATNDDFTTVVNELGEHLSKAQDLRAPLYDGEHRNTERALERRELKELIDYDVGDRVALEFDHDTDAAAIGFVTEPRDTVDLLLVYQFSDLLNELRLVNLVGNFIDNDSLSFALIGFEPLNVELGAELEQTTTGFVNLADGR